MTPSPARAFLAGGSGFVGRGILRRLIADGREVIALAHAPASSRALEEMGATVVSGDLLDTDVLTGAMAGCTVVYNAAGLNAFCLRDPSPLYRVNVEGAVSVVRAASRAGVHRVVHTSSGSTIGEEPGTVGREDSPHRGSFHSDYERSKYEGERAVLAAGERCGVEVVSVNPASVQGPGRTGGTARLLIDYVNGRLKFFVETRLSLVDIDDCSRGHVLAESLGAPGQRYLLSGATLSTREALELVSRLAGINRRVTNLPAAVATGGASLVEAACRMLRKKPPVCREQALAVVHGHTYDGSRATEELGLTYTPVEETFRRTLAWYEEHGYLHPKL